MIQITENPKGNIYAIIAKAKKKTAFGDFYLSDYSQGVNPMFDGDLVMCTGVAEESVMELCVNVEEQPYYMIPVSHLRETTEAEKEQYRSQFVHHNID